MNDTVLVGLITAVAAVGGAAVGGVFTYQASHEGLKEQEKREERQQSARTRGVARIYVEQINSANGILRNILKEDRWPARTNVVYFALPELEDRRLIQSVLLAKSSARLDDADEAMRAVVTIITAEPEHKLSVRARQLVVGWSGNLERGAAALRYLEG